MLRKTTITAGLVGLAIFATGTSAYAYWTVYGQGTATATVATMKPLKIMGEPVTGMVIGVPKDLTGVIKNPNDFEASLTGLTFTVEATTDRKACGPKNFTVVKPVRPPFTKIAAKESVPFGGGTITLTENGKNQMACQGTVVSLAYSLR